jgi:hypothetical protein
VQPQGKDKKALWEAASKLYEAIAGKKTRTYEEAFPDEVEDTIDDAET